MRIFLESSVFFLLISYVSLITNAVIFTTLNPFKSGFNEFCSLLTKYFLFLSLLFNYYAVFVIE